MWCESSDRGTLISEIHPGGLCPASLLSVQTLNFPTKATRITAQPFARCFSSHTISQPLMLLLFFLSLSHHCSFKTHKKVFNFVWMPATQTRRPVIKRVFTQKCLFPDLMTNNSALTHAYKNTHTHHMKSHCAHFTECVKQYKQLEIWLLVQSTKCCFDVILKNEISENHDKRHNRSAALK